MSTGQALVSRPITCPAHPRQLAFRTEDCVRETALPQGNTKCCAHRCQQPSRMCQVCLAEGASYGPSTRVLQPPTGDGFCHKHRPAGVTEKEPGKAVVVEASAAMGPSLQPASRDISARLALMVKKLETAPVVLLHPRSIRPMPGQPRVEFDEALLGALATSINDTGQLQPIVVRQLAEPDGGVTHELVDGERRWRAVALLQGKELRCQVIDVDDSEVTFVLAVIANFNRVGHNHWEVSCAFKRMSDTGLTNRFISRLCGRSEFYVGQMLSLQKLDPSLVPLLERKGRRDRYLPLQVAIAVSKASQRVQKSIAEKYFSGELRSHDLRDTVVVETKSAGETLRERRMEPNRVWEVLTNRTGQLDDIVRLMQKRIQSLESAHYLGRNDKLTEIVTSLEASEAQLQAVIRSLKEKF